MDGNKGRLVGDWGLGVGKPEFRAPYWPLLVPGLDILRDEPGREEITAGLSEVKKLDFRLPGDGDGGICESVSIVRSDKDGLAFRDNVRGVYGGSVFSGPKGSTGTLDSIVKRDSVCCGWVMVLSAVPANAGLR